MEMRQLIRIIEGRGRPMVTENAGLDAYNDLNWMDSSIWQDVLAERPEIEPPRYLFHHTGRANQESIHRQGLLVRHSETALIASELGEKDWHETGSIYMALKPSRTGGDIDIWLVDTQGMSLEWDSSNEDDPTDYWFCVHHDILPQRLTLFMEGQRQILPIPHETLNAIRDAYFGVYDTALRLRQSR